MSSGWCVMNFLENCASFGIVIVNVNLFDEDVRGKKGHMTINILPHLKVLRSK